MSDLEKEVRDGQQASYILTHPLVVSAFESLESALNNALTEAPERDIEGLKNLVLMKKCLKRFKGIFESHINTGKLASRQIEDLQRRGVRRFF